MWVSLSQLIHSVEPPGAKFHKIETAIGGKKDDIEYILKSFALGKPKKW
jgi:hypothetical protein